ncbi:hypothetical protein EVJ58_g10354 [Rhodofomes roseus]|uniref:Uncharacterized protein n=1 Tax=Rhodofomes roseus TaxID=34475 RepID=A0A4Y9XP11_9APHY|nr:hypothetical protein EVJ58_g10354 [Rhodofomes roseus]
MMAPVDSDLDDEEPFVMEDVFVEVALAASEPVAVAAVAEGRDARDAAADEAFVEDAPELVEVAGALLVVDDADEDEEEPEEELDLLLLLLDGLEELADELGDDVEDADDEDELTVTLVVTSFCVITESP